MPALRRITELCERREVVALAALLALALTAPSLGVDLVTDDFIHRSFLLEHLGAGPSNAPWWQMFGRVVRDPLANLVPIHLGALPWWASPSFSLAFFRPLTVATHIADYALWPGHPALMHLQNMVWYALLVMLAAALYRRLFGPSVVAALAAFVYAADDAHAAGVAWIAGRNTVLSALFATAAVLLFARARRQESRGALALSACAAALGLASGEGGIAAFAYIAAYAAWLDRAAWRTRAAWLAPHGALLALYLAGYRVLGYGVHGSGLYLDPLADPLPFAWNVLVRLPIVLHEQFAVPGLLYRLSPEAAWPLLVVLGFSILALCAWPIARLLRRSATSRFFATGLLLSAVPICAIGVTPRLLFMVGLGGAGLIAELIDAGAAAIRSVRPLMRANAVAAATALVAVHLVMALLIAPLAPRLLTSYDARVRAVERGLPSSADLAQKALLLLNVRDSFMTAMAFIYRGAEGGTLPRSVHVLSSGDASVRLSRLTRDTLLLEPRGGFLRDEWSSMVRKPEERFAVGQVVLLSDLAVRVDALTSDGRPARVRLTMPNPEDPHLLWMAWSGDAQRFVQVAVPALGRSLVLRAVMPGTGRREPPLLPF